MGLDGEGQGEADHVYNMICASDETGERTWTLRSDAPDVALGTYEILAWLMTLPRNARLFTFSFNYDLTKMLKDLPNEVLFKLFRPETRQRLGKDAFKGPRAIIFGSWRFNLQGTKFTVTHGRRTVVIWDIWKFYQCKFTKACGDWSVGKSDELAFMTRMKDKRKEFDQLTPEEVERYCLLECRFMAELAHKLTDAHDTAGIPLKAFHGAGSSATAIMKKMSIRDYMKEPPDEMIDAVARAFSGGRFDNRLIGPVYKPTASKDISSAYPYATQFLPCLAHGRWVRTKSRRAIDDCTLACVRYSLRNSASVDIHSRPWGPFPFREEDGSICYPAVSGGGWVWHREFLEAERLFGNVQFREAWVYHQECDHRPFKDMPHYYNERCRLGKEGAGLALKTASNSVPGKTAQSVGTAPFRNFVWAGNINSHTRSQVLHGLGLHRDWRDMLMVATDGIVTLDHSIRLPDPIDTGTNIPFFDKKKKAMVCKPLGGWETDVKERGMFFARPGVYFPLNPSEGDLQVVRARGVGRGVVLENWAKIVEAFDAWDKRIVRRERDGFDKDGWPVIAVSNVSRFCGAKSSISRRVVDGKFQYNRANGNHMLGRPGHKSGSPEPAYGQWIIRNVVMSFNPSPKRVNRKLGPDGQSLLLRKLPEDVESAPYSNANMSEETRIQRMIQLELDEQPDKDYADYGFDQWYD